MNGVGASAFYNTPYTTAYPVLSVLTAEPIAALATPRGHWLALGFVHKGNRTQREQNTAYY